MNVAQLTVEQAVELAVAILAENPDALQALARRLPSELTAELGARLLAPAAVRSIARRARPPEPGGVIH